MRIFGNTSSKLALVALVAGGCGGDGFSPPDGAEDFDPPAIYNILWQETEDCSQLTAPMSRVHWYMIPGTSTFPCDYGNCRGLWEVPHNIYLSEVAAHDCFGDNFFTVRHEILHDLVGQPGHLDVFQQCGLLRDEAPG